MPKRNKWLMIFILLFTGLFLLPLAKPLARNAVADTEAAVAAEHPSGEEAVSFNAPIVGEARLTARFGEMKDPFSGKIVFHNGVDLAAKTGTPVNAAASGKILEARNEKGLGNYILIQHEQGFQTFYSHLHTLIANEGQTVKAGEEIGTVGSTGKSTGPHLHFEIRLNGDPVDPFKYIDAETYSRNK